MPPQQLLATKSTVREICYTICTSINEWRWWTLLLKWSSSLLSLLHNEKKKNYQALCFRCSIMRRRRIIKLFAIAAPWWEEEELVGGTASSTIATKSTAWRKLFLIRCTKCKDTMTMMAGGMITESTRFSNSAGKRWKTLLESRADSTHPRPWQQTHEDRISFFLDASPRSDL